MDSVISSEIPSKNLDPQYYEAVQEFMVHGPCGVARKQSPCMVNGKCTNTFLRSLLILSVLIVMVIQYIGVGMMV